MPAKDFVTRPQLSTPANDQHCKSFGDMAKYFCTILPTSLNAFCPQKYHHLCPDSQRIWRSFDLRDMEWPHVCISPLPGVRSGKVTERSVCFSHQCFLKFPAALRWQTLARSVTAFETDREEKNKTISDGCITVDFSIIKVHTSNWSSNSWGSSNSSCWDHRIVVDHRIPLDL